MDTENRKILLLKRANTGWFDGCWSVPAGRLDQGESASVGARRELFEETGVVAREGRWNDPYVMHHKNETGERTYFFFVCTNWEGEPKNMEPEKCDALEWYALDSLPEGLLPHVSYALSRLLDSSERYSEWGFTA